MTMNENQSPAFGRETDSMDCVSKEIYEPNDSSWDIREAKGCYEHQNHKVTNRISMDDENELVDSPRKGGQNGLPHNPSGQDAEPLPSDRFDEETEQRSREHECLMTVKECTDLSQIEATSFDDKVVLDCDATELEVCYKEIDHQHMVKDICVDEGKPEKGCMLTGRAKEESFNKEILGSVEEEISPVKDNDRNADQCGNVEQKDMSSATDAPNCCHGEDIAPTVETNFCTAATADSSVVGKKIPMENFGMQTSLRSLLKSLDGEEITDKQLPTQIADEEAVSHSQDFTLVNEEEQGEVVPNWTKLRTTNEDEVKEQFFVSKKDSNQEKFVNDKSRDISGKDKNEDCPSCNKPVQLGNVQTIEADAPNLPSHDLPGNNPFQLGNSQTVEADVPKHGRWISGDTSVVGRMPKDDGEMSFSAASLINYSEPVPFSGSLSHRSDSSATSARSFAFPVLPSEWNSSPVRMAKANRKHRCWRSGLFCCRF